MASPTLPLRLVDAATVRDLSSRDLDDEQFYNQFSPYVARIGMRLLGRSADVDDLVQEVFIAAYKKRDQLPNEGATRGWLAVVSVRTARRMLRKRRVRQFVGLDLGTPPLELLDRTLSPDERALLSRIYQILDQMNVDYRLAWTLRYIEGEKLEDVALRCGCSLATAKRRIAAAHAHLQSEMDGG